MHNRGPKLITVIFIVSLICYACLGSKFTPSESFNKYPSAAEQISNGELDPERRLEFSFLYLTVHRALHLLTLDSPMHAYGLQMFVTSGSAVFCFLLFRTFFPVLLSIAGLIIFLFNKSLILYTFTLEPEVFLIFFVVGFLYFLSRKNTSYILAGIFLGLAILTRPVLTPMLVIVPVMIMFRVRGLKPKYKSVLLFLFAPVFLLSLLLLRNHGITGRWTLSTMSPGLVFYIGNNPTAGELLYTYPPLVDEHVYDFKGAEDLHHVMMGQFAARTVSDTSGKTSANRFWMNRAANFIRDAPAHAFKRALGKILYIFHDYRAHDLLSVSMLDDLYLSRQWTVPYGLISALAVLGLLLGLTQWRDLTYIYIVFVLLVSLMSLFYVSDRQRIVMLPIMIFYALYFLNKIPTIKWKRASGVACVAALMSLIFLFNRSTVSIRESEYLRQRDRLAAGYLETAVKTQAQDDDHAVRKNLALAFMHDPTLTEHTRSMDRHARSPGIKRQALELGVKQLNRENPSEIFDLGYLSLLNDDYELAGELFFKLSQGKFQFKRGHEQSSLPEYYLARIHAFNGDRDAALRSLHSALKKNPGDIWSLSLAHAISPDSMYYDKLNRYYDKIDVSFFLGQAFFMTEQYDKAFHQYSYVSDRLPLYGRAKVYLNRARANMKTSSQ